MMKEPIKPERFFEDKFGITKENIEKVLGDMLSPQVNYSDLYFEYKISETINLEEGIVKKATRNITQGVGVRAMSEDKTGYAFSDDITPSNLETSAKTARQVAERGEEAKPFKVGGYRSPDHDLYPVKTPPTDVPVKEKIEFLQGIDEIGRRYDARIKNVLATYAAEYKIILIATSDGIVVGDAQPLFRLSVSCIAEDGANRQQGRFGGGGRVEHSFFLDENRFERYTKEAARQAIIGLEASDVPAGTMDVVLAPGWPGILLHEAVGHGLEGDFNRKKTSAFSDRIGERVASELCAIVDDGTIPSRRGSLNIDDEGTHTGQTVLIENGILKGYMQDRLNASLMKMPFTGNGRRESYAHIPMPRMTNTFMLPGDYDPEEIIHSVTYGLYAVYFSGGQVDITSGKFVFSASEAYMIEDGRVTRPVKGATLIGNGPDILKRVSMVGSDLRLDEGIGTCGKNGQGVPVGVGLPTIKVSGITVGGTRR